MYYLEELVGTVVTFKTTNGLEIIAKLLAHDDENDMITFGEPRVIVINGEGEMALIPYAYTADTKIMLVHEQHVVTVLETNIVTTEDYLRIVQSTETANEVEGVDEEFVEEEEVE